MGIIQKLMACMAMEGDIERELRELESHLGMIKCYFHDVGKKQVQDVVMIRWLRNLEDFAFEAEDVVHMFKEKQQNRVRLGRKIRDLNEKYWSSMEGGIGREVMNLPEVAPESPEETTEVIDMNTPFIGREKDMSAILAMILNTPTNQVLSILPIVGMGGLGKTTLARYIFNNENVQSHFQLRVWIHASTKFNRKSLLKNILSSLGSKKAESDIVDVLVHGLQEELTSKSFLIIFDEVWINSHEEWQYSHEEMQWVDFIRELRSICSVKGNVIITTMRNRNFPSVVGTLATYELKCLSRDNCWEIIKEEALKEERDRESSWFQNIGAEIAKKCEGLPLAASTVGKFLRGKSKKDWFLVEEKGISGFQGKLKQSVDHLPLPSLKRCFAYCSVFPKGSWIGREQLIELWMAEGFLQTTDKEQASDMESVGNHFVNLLVHHSLLEIVDSDEEFYSIHNLMHDVAASLLDKSRYIRTCSESLSPEEKEKVRSLFYRGEIAGLVFSKLKSVRALTLSGNIKELPDSIRVLLHLRLLDITETNIESLPESIGKLYHLQTFRSCHPIYGSAPLKRLPITFKFLVSLRHIKVGDETELSPQVGFLTSLQTLPFFKVRDEDGYRIVELQNLKNFKGCLKIENLENVKDEEEARSACLFEKSDIVSLTLMWNGSGEDERNDNENVLKGLQPHHGLKILQISGFKGSSFPSWTLKMAVHRRGLGWVELDHLMEVKLKSCECEDIPMLGHLPCLQSLHLSGLKKVRSISYSFYGIDKCSSNDGVQKTVFPTLERMEVFDMPNLITWDDVAEIQEAREVVVFPYLEYLEIKNCNQLRTAPKCFRCVKELKTDLMLLN